MGDPTDQSALQWTDLVARATLGTNRRPDGPLGSILGVEVPTSGGVEHRLLAGAAMLWAATRASRQPDVVGAVEDRWQPPPPDGLVPAPASAADLLDVLLHGGHVPAAQQTSVVRRWLGVASTAGWRVPAHLLTATLTRAGTDLPSSASPALGAHGRWLMGLSPKWADVVMDDDTAAVALQTATRSRDRGAAAAHLWRDDAEQGRAVLAAAWPTMRPDARVRVIESVMAFIVPTDEAWLEGARHDGPAPVSQQAAAALQTLPDSRRTGRMGQRLTTVVTITPRRLRSPIVARDDTVRPDRGDLDDATTAPPATGLTTWWQTQVLTGAPLSAWASLLGDVDRAVTVQSSDHTILRMVCTAAGAQRDVEWCTRLLPAVLARHIPDPSPAGGGDAPAVPAVQWGQWLRALSAILEPLPAPWSDTTTTQVLDWAARHPSPLTALIGLSDLLTERAGPALDHRFADAGVHHDPGNLTISRQIGRIRTVRSLTRAIDAMPDIQEPR